MNWISVQNASRIYSKKPNNFYFLACMDKKQGKTDRFKYKDGVLMVNVTKLKMNDDGEYTISEIADKLGLTKSQVSHALDSGLRKLKQKLEQMEIENV